MNEYNGVMGYFRPTDPITIDATGRTIYTGADFPDEEYGSGINRVNLFCFSVAQVGPHAHYVWFQRPASFPIVPRLGDTIVLPYRSIQESQTEFRVYGILLVPESSTVSIFIQDTDTPLQQYHEAYFMDGWGIPDSHTARILPPDWVEPTNRFKHWEHY